jgi:hypothetical protein
MDLIDNHQLNPWMDENPVLKWKVLEEFTPIPDKSVFIDDDKVDYCFDVFTKALKHCDSVMFAYDHDAILYRLEMDDAYDLEIINIDYHADLLNATPYSDAMEVFNNDDMEVLSYEYDTFQVGKVMEGNWVGWLDWKGKIKNYTWIHGIRSLGGPDDDNTGRFSDTYHEIFSSNLNYYLKENYTFDDYKFDFIFVCLSPNYVPQKFWNIFTKYLSEYEKVTGKPYKLINRKYEIDARYRELHKYTLPRNK